MQVRQRTGAFIGLLVVLLFFPIHILARGDTQLVVSVVFQTIFYLVSLGMFVGDRGHGAVAVLLGIAFGIVGILLSMILLFLIAFSGGLGNWG